VTQVNDGVTPISLSGGGSTKARFLGSVGGGLEYFIADDIALGVEGKYMFTGSDSFTAGETTTSIDLNTALLTFGMRLFYPELHPEVSSYSASRAARRFYVSMRAGGALPVHTVVFPGVKATPEQDVFGSNFSLLYAVSMGVHLTPWLDLELSGSNYELDLSFTESPQTTEYTVFPVLLQPRIHWPVRNARLDPYALAGIGAEIVEVNDKTDPTTEVHGTGVAVIGALGLGLDYFVTKNIAFGLETKYIFSRGHTLQLEDGPVLGGNLDSLVISIGVRAFLFGF
jgi:opacity protein-like surface antigen